ncbi:hypothetical protein GCM10022252_26810 [Streptosporangium oxazolinicum]|uniref:Cell wall-active antibiotics response LiaF-like C-terminal domain-containing protein n=1 Tax=Streptosporangium oxazolinicum TaxID=909287 RepID=A0ABP8AT59_9ACTN
MRVSDAEREAAVEWLRVASVEGRLTLGELTERTEAAYTAVTQAQLAVLTADLPGGRPAPAPAYSPPPASPGGQVRRWFVAVMSSSKRRGSWRIDKPLGAVAVMGDVLLDLRQAEVRTGGVVDIMATAVMGNVKIIVPDGVDVQLDGIAVMGDKKVQVVEAPPGTNAPLVRVTAYVLMGDVKVVGDSRTKPLKKAIAAWRKQWDELRVELTGEYGHYQAGPGPHQVHPSHQEHPHSWPPAPPQPPYPPQPPRPPQSPGY